MGLNQFITLFPTMLFMVSFIVFYLLFVIQDYYTIGLGNCSCLCVIICHPITLSLLPYCQPTNPSLDQEHTQKNNAPYLKFPHRPPCKPLFLLEN